MGEVKQKMKKMKKSEIFVQQLFEKVCKCLQHKLIINCLNKNLMLMVRNRLIVKCLKFVSLITLCKSHVRFKHSKENTDNQSFAIIAYKSSLRPWGCSTNGFQLDLQPRVTQAGGARNLLINKGFDLIPT